MFKFKLPKNNVWRQIINILVNAKIKIVFVPRHLCANQQGTWRHPRGGPCGWRAIDTWAPTDPSASLAPWQRPGGRYPARIFLLSEKNYSSCVCLWVVSSFDTQGDQPAACTYLDAEQGLSAFLQTLVIHCVVCRQHLEEGLVARHALVLGAQQLHATLTTEW